MIKGYKYIKGYLKAEISGGSIEKFLNMSIKNKVYIWDMKRLTPGKAVFFVSAKGFLLACKNAEEAGCEVRVVERLGLPTFIKAKKKRGFFFIFAAAAVAMIFIASSFIWVVEIEEQNFTDNGKILEKLAEMDLKPGALRKNIDYNAVTDSLINSLDEILWASIELDGTKLKVKVVPRKIAPPIIAKNIPVDIVAKKDGFVTKVISENGLAKVKAGDTVIKGQVLISGVVTSERADSRYVHSMGEIEAVTWVNKSVEKKLYNYKKIPTGNKIKKRYLHLPFIKIPLQFNETIDFYNYDSIIKEENIFFITFKEHIYEEYLLEKEPVEYDTAVEEGVLELDGYIKDENVSNIVSRKTEHEKKDDETVIVSLLVECKENIGEEREIKF